MKPLLSLTKQELADIINDCREQEDALNEICDTNQHKIESLMLDVNLSEAGIRQLENKIYMMRAAMKTIIATKHPSVSFDENDFEFVIDPSYETEELLFLQYLYRLSK